VTVSVRARYNKLGLNHESEGVEGNDVGSRGTSGIVSEVHQLSRVASLAGLHVTSAALGHSHSALVTRMCNISQSPSASPASKTSLIQKLYYTLGSENHAQGYIVQKKIYA